jgi:hypothetical protein
MRPLARRTVRAIDSDFLPGSRERIRKTKVTTSHETFTLSQIAGQVTDDLTDLAYRGSNRSCRWYAADVRNHVSFM